MAAMTIHIATLTAAIQHGNNTTRLQLLPAGTFRAADGRPADIAGWVLTQVIADRVIAQFDKRKNDTVIDFEHQSFNASHNGKQAPAAGWFNTISFGAGGMFAENVEMTAKAQQMIAAKEYRYVSSVFQYDPNTGAVLNIINAALTNTPALDGMQGLTAANKFSNSQVQSIIQSGTVMSAKPTPQVVAVASAFAVTGELSAAQNSALASYTAAAVAAATVKQDEQITALQAQLATSKDHEKQISVLTAQLKATTSGVPAAAVATLQTELNQLKAAVANKEHAAVITAAQDHGQLTAAMAEWAATISTESLTAYLEKTPKVAALSNRQSAGGMTTNTSAELTPAELAICRRTGTTLAAFKAARLSMSQHQE